MDLGSYVLLYNEDDALGILILRLAAYVQDDFATIATGDGVQRLLAGAKSGFHLRNLGFGG